MDATACFTFDNMAEAADVGAGVLSGPLQSERHPSLSHGYPNLYTLLERHGVRATFFVEGWNGVHHPDAVAEVVARGHELGMHGWVHEAWSSLDPQQEAELAARATAALEQACGVRPIGFRAPGGSRSPHTEAVLLRLGYVYDASLGDAMRPTVLGSGLVQVPFVWSAVDGFYYLRQPAAEPATVRDTWLRALERSIEPGGLFVLICHAFITGVDPARLAALESVIHAAVTDGRVRIRTVGDVARDVRATRV
jgi:peptidoglycan/xylan/chitin deacetylase (PgdA/CDA1 family)